MYIPPLKWKPRPMISFDQVVNGAIAALRGNPAIAKKLGWDLSPAAMADRVDEFNARVCEANGWTEYIQWAPVASVPKTSPREQMINLKSLRDAAANAKALFDGAKTLIEWIDSNEPPVPQELADKRAEVCAACSMNDPEDFGKWFTVPAAELIRRQIEKAHARGLSTPKEANLNLCTACHCPLKLKVHVPIPWITKRITDEQTRKLRIAKGCWIISESNL